MQALLICQPCAANAFSTGPEHHQVTDTHQSAESESPLFPRSAIIPSLGGLKRLPGVGTIAEDMAGRIGEILPGANKICAGQGSGAYAKIKLVTTNGLKPSIILARDFRSSEVGN
jgi:hypothetical protein